MKMVDQFSVKINTRIVRRQKPFRFRDQDGFCKFVVDGKMFLAIEPFGDNTVYLVVPDPPEECPQIDKVREAFAKYRVLFGLYAG